jgi:hypothetical protein
MMLEKLIVFVEEPSMEAALEIILPRILAGCEKSLSQSAGNHP